MTDFDIDIEHNGSPADDCGGEYTFSEDPVAESRNSELQRNMHKQPARTETAAA
jgi:hypothetical protein